MRPLLALLAVVIALVAIAPRASAERDTVRVIVNAQHPTAKLSRSFVADAFLKKRTRWSGDDAIRPVDLGQKHPVRARFTRGVLGRDVGAVRRYWAQLVFSGRGVPPPEVTDEAAVVAYVAKHAGAIGYVSASAPLTGVKVVIVE